MATHFSLLAWKIPWVEQPTHEITKSGTWLSSWAHAGNLDPYSIFLTLWKKLKITLKSEEQIETNLKKKIRKIKWSRGISLLGQWLRIHLPMQAGNTVSIPDQGTKILHAAQQGKKENWHKCHRLELTKITGTVLMEYTFRELFYYSFIFIFVYLNIYLFDCVES